MDIDAKQRCDPTMLVVAVVDYVGEIRWSNGHGRWTARWQNRHEVGPPLKRGYWILYQRWPYEPAFAGETIEEVKNVIADALETRINDARRPLNAEIQRAQSRSKFDLEKIYATSGTEGGYGGPRLYKP